MQATFPFGVTAPATSSPVSAFIAVPLDASPKLWQSAAAKNMPSTVTAESEEPCPARISWRSGHPPARILLHTCQGYSTDGWNVQ